MKHDLMDTKQHSHDQVVNLCRLLTTQKIILFIPKERVKGIIKALTVKK